MATFTKATKFFTTVLIFSKDQPIRHQGICGYLCVTLYRDPSMPEDNHWKAYHLFWNSAQIYGYGCNPTAPSSSLQEMQVKLFEDDHGIVFLSNGGRDRNYGSTFVSFADWPPPSPGSLPLFTHSAKSISSSSNSSNIHLVCTSVMSITAVIR